MLAFEQRLLAVVHSSGTYNAAVRIVYVFTLKSEKIVQFDHKKMKTTESYISCTCGTTLYINQVWNAVHILLRLLRGPTLQKRAHSKTSIVKMQISEK